MVCVTSFDVDGSAVLVDGFEGQESVLYKLSNCVLIMK